MAGFVDLKNAITAFPAFATHSKPDLANPLILFIVPIVLSSFLIPIFKYYDKQINVQLRIYSN
jgi:hypothetical protein